MPGVDASWQGDYGGVSRSSAVPGRGRAVGLTAWSVNNGGCMNAFATPSNRSSYSGLGACWIVYGLLRFVIAVCLVVYAQVATVMFGALLVRVADYITAMELFHACYIFAIILSVLCGIFGVLGGVVLLRQPTSRLVIIAAFLSLSELPIGITLGVYTLLTMFRARRAE
jgi:hypothetical protein